MNTRRNFLRQIAITAGTPALLCNRLLAQDKPALIPLTETDPMGAALGYKEDASKVDTTKYAQYKAGQKCQSCALYQGKPDDKVAACTIFAGKTVTAAGWCAAFAPKPPAQPAPTPEPAQPAPTPEPITK